MAVEEDIVTEFVPLEGDDLGVGSFFGIICSQYPLGNLDASERTMKARRLKSKHLCLQEPDMLSTLEKCSDPSFNFQRWLLITWGSKHVEHCMKAANLFCLRKDVPVADNGVLNNSKTVSSSCCFPHYLIESKTWMSEQIKEFKECCHSY